MRVGVDVHRLLHQLIGAVEESLSGHDSSVVHQDVHVTHVLLHLDATVYISCISLKTNHRVSTSYVRHKCAGGFC